MATASGVGFFAELELELVLVLVLVLLLLLAVVVVPVLAARELSPENCDKRSVSKSGLRAQGHQRGGTLKTCLVLSWSCRTHCV